MEIIQFLIIIFAIFVLTRIVLQLKNNNLTIPEFFIWLMIWIAIIIIALLPSVTSLVAKFIGIGRGVDMLIYGGLLIVFYLVFRLIIKVEELQQEITKIVREIALKDISFNSSKNTFKKTTKKQKRR